MKKRESIIHIENRLDFFLRSKPKVGLLFCAGLSPSTEHARSRGLFATEETRHGRPSAPAAGAPRHPGAMFASVVRTMMGVNAEPRKFRCVRYASLAGRASRVGHIERFSDTSAEAHRIVPVRRRDRPPSAPHPPEPFRRPLAGSTSPSATSPGSPPAWTPPCSRWCAPADVSRDVSRATAHPPTLDGRAKKTFLTFAKNKRSVLRASRLYPDKPCGRPFVRARRCAKGKHPCRPRARPPCRSRTEPRGGCRATRART